METKVISQPIEFEKLQALARQGFGDMVKAVVDLEQKLWRLGPNCTPMRKQPLWIKAHANKISGVATFTSTSPVPTG
jgi:hypothetical protein